MEIDKQEGSEIRITNLRIKILGILEQLLKDLKEEYDTNNSN